MTNISASRPPEKRSPRKIDGAIPDILPSEELWQIHVLVVDDDPADTWLISHALRADRRVRTITTEGAADQALEKLRKGDLKPHLILLDLKMPKMDGLLFIRLLKTIPAVANIPVVILTTSGEIRDVFAARHKGISGYVIKPDSVEKLRARLLSVVSIALQEWKVR